MRKITKLTSPRGQDARPTQKRNRLRQQRALGSLIETALDSVPQGIAVYDDDEVIRYANSRFSELLGIRKGQICSGMKLQQLLDAHAQRIGTASMYEVAFAKHGLKRTRAVLHINKAVNRIVTVTQHAVATGGWVATVEDVTDRRNVERKYSLNINSDSLTDLPNRASFMELLQQSISHSRQEKKIALLCVDINRFNRVNEMYGNEVGDTLLKAVVYRLANCIRTSDTLARTGSDEFAIIQAGVKKPKDAAVLASRISEALSQPYRVGPNSEEVSVSAKIGIAIAPVDGIEVDVLMKHANLAMYRAKNITHTDYSFYEPGLDADLITRHALEQEMKHALQRNEFELYYQRFVNLEKGNVVGYEALLRWQHPERGILMPDKFIPIAEECGLIDDLGHWVIRSATQQASQWQRGTRLAINLSPLQLQNRALHHVIQESLKQAKLPAKQLEIEITESTFLHNSTINIKMLQRLKRLGARIVLDDFGTGYSSLGYLLDFSFDKLKIDRSFISGYPNNRQSALLVNAIVGLGDSFGMVVSAEGVEKLSQVRQLRAVGCQEAQGFYFGRPEPMKGAHHSAVV